MISVIWIFSIYFKIPPKCGSSLRMIKLKDKTTIIACDLLNLVSSSFLSFMKWSQTLDLDLYRFFCVCGSLIFSMALYPYFLIYFFLSLSICVFLAKSKTWTSCLSLTLLKEKDVKCFSDAFTSRGLYIYSTAHIAFKKRTCH